MSQWKGPFEELYGFALETGAKDTVDQLKSLKDEFARTGTIGGRTLDMPNENVGAVIALIEEKLLEDARKVKQRHPYSWGIVKSNPPRVF